MQGCLLRTALALSQDSCGSRQANKQMVLSAKARSLCSQACHCCLLGPPNNTSSKGGPLSRRGVCQQKGIPSAEGGPLDQDHPSSKQDRQAATGGQSH